MGDPLLLHITQGHYDTMLDGIVLAAQGRQVAIGQPVSGRTVKVEVTKVDFDPTLEWNPGDKAVLQDLSPKYMVGAPVTIKHKIRTRYKVAVDPAWMANHPQAQKRFGQAQNMIVYPNMLRKP